jgi:hypothetical protein
VQYLYKFYMLHVIFKCIGLVYSQIVERTTIIVHIIKFEKQKKNKNYKNKKFKMAYTKFFETFIKSNNWA